MKRSTLLIVLLLIEVFFFNTSIARTSYFQGDDDLSGGGGGGPAKVIFNVADATTFAMPKAELLDLELSNGNIVSKEELTLFVKNNGEVIKDIGTYYEISTINNSSIISIMNQSGAIIQLEEALPALD